MKKIYCFNNSWAPGRPRHDFNNGLAIAEDGTALAGHLSSTPEWCKHDMMASWKHDKYDAHYGKGNWELVWVDDPSNARNHADEGFRFAVLAAEAKYEKEQAPDVGSKVVLEMSDGTKIERTT